HEGCCGLRAVIAAPSIASTSWLSCVGYVVELDAGRFGDLLEHDVLLRAVELHLLALVAGMARIGRGVVKRGALLLEVLAREFGRLDRGPPLGLAVALDAQLRGERLAADLDVGVALH